MSVITLPSGKHSRFGPSSSERWMNCKGSLNLIEKLPHGGGRSSQAAAEGTVAHYIGSEILRGNVEGWSLIGTTIESDGHAFEVTADMVEGVQLYVDFVNQKLEQHKDKGAYLIVEQWMQSVLDDEAGGTSDAIIVVPNERLIVVDLKFGIGVKVEPDTPQLKMYAYLALESITDWSPDENTIIEAVIVQPRIPHSKGPIRKHVMNASEVTNWFINDVLKSMEESRDPNATLEIGEWCRFCPARDVCPALRRDAESLDVSIDPEVLTGKELGDVLRRVEVVHKYLSKLQETAYRRANLGEKIDGYKLVKKKANRTWKDKAIREVDGEAKELTVEEIAKLNFGTDAFTTPSLKSPAQIENLPGGKDFAKEYAYIPDSGTTLAPESDPRPAVQNAMSMAIKQFDNAAGI